MTGQGNPAIAKIDMYSRLPSSQELPSSTLASQDTVSAFVYQMLTIASAGGMSETRAKELYEEIMECYAHLDGSALECFRSDFLRILGNTNSN